MVLRFERRKVNELTPKAAPIVDLSRRAVSQQLRDSGPWTTHRMSIGLIFETRFAPRAGSAKSSSPSFLTSVAGARPSRLSFSTSSTARSLKV
jgi:hypothetical protein